LGYKADLYRRAKIPQYWMVDVPNRCVWIFTLAGER
jgi:Uma2 family endonuclease